MKNFKHELIGIVLTFLIENLERDEKYNNQDDKYNKDEENEENKFSEDQIYAIKKFHFKAPNIIIKGIHFIESEEVY